TAPAPCSMRTSFARPCLTSTAHCARPVDAHQCTNYTAYTAYLRPKGPGGHTVSVEYASEWRNRGHCVLVRPRQGPCTPVSAPACAFCWGAREEYLWHRAPSKPSPIAALASSGPR